MFCIQYVHCTVYDHVTECGQFQCGAGSPGMIVVVDGFDTNLNLVLR